ncbi:unnamed protein product [Adineta steineri]|uniref:TIR domain-containing protein n=1 Tax=Adineta steineri TaxID=433720 RepID=A0A814NS65_9BILA|nr:unnamed protein product [Adineta steineri]
MATPALKQGQHIMFSYGWDIQKDVLEIYHRLQAHNIPVWMDIQGGMKDYLTESMSEAIENSAAVCCFITSKYQSSPYCKKELLYAQDCQKKLIPCLMDSDPTWKPTEWLGYAIIDIMYIDFRDLLRNKTPENLDAKCDLLIKRIKRTADPGALGDVHYQQEKTVVSTSHNIDDQDETDQDEKSDSSIFTRYLPHPSHFS